MIEVHGVNIPEQPKVPSMPESFLKAEYDRLLQAAPEILDKIKGFWLDYVVKHNIIAMV